jgi:hypothetical protein
MGKAAGKLLKWSLVGGAGMYAAAAAVRFADHRRSEGLARPTALPDGEPVEGIRSADGTPLYVEAIGEGPTVFLIHGLACNHTTGATSGPISRTGTGWSPWTCGGTGDRAPRRAGTRARSGWPRISRR